jgi:micrococcal nuclease
MRRALVVTLAVLIALALVVWLVDDDAGRAPVTAPDGGIVLRIVDGDTLEAEVAGGASETVRLLGIDTPESVAPDRPVECWGHEATEVLRGLLPPGTEVRLERDVEARDRFGRLLAYVFRQPDGLFVNEALAAAGAADTLTIEPNHAYAAQLADAVAGARARGEGQWGACR